MASKISIIKEGNLWYPPTESLFKFLDKVSKSGLGKNLAVLGCADGNYVLPAVSKGFKVLAIDIDEVALHGGTAKINGVPTKVTGLEKKLKKIGKQKKVEILNTSYLDYSPKTKFAAVIASEGIHYEANEKYTLAEIINKIQSYVKTGGFVMIEHLHLSEKNSDPKKYMTSEQLSSYFPKPEWKVLSNKKKVYKEEANLRINRVHEVIIGRLYAQKIK